MPTSALAVWPFVLNLVETAHPHRTVLDIGAGWGKASVLIREYLNVKPRCIDAVEAWEPYVEGHGLRRLYDDVIVSDVVLVDADRLAVYDVVLMVDVIEHLGKEDALALLDRIPGRVVICTPMVFFDNPEGLPWTETHRSHWTAEDFGGRVEVDASRPELGALIVRLGPLR